VSFKFGESPTAIDHLAAFWMRSDSGDRQAITAAVDRIERILTRSADTVGISHPFGNLPTARRLDTAPVSAIFVFLPSVGQVFVLDYVPTGP
jgi:hypothetical protein